MTTTDSFYNQHAQHFHQTRQRPRPEYNLITNTTQQYLQDHNTQTKISIIDLGCGSGRLSDLFVSFDNNHIEYTGIDSAQELIAIAQQQHPSQQFIRQDMISYLENIPPQSVDIAISLASFQHLSSKKERKYALQLLYQALKYDGIHISINRSRSRRMIRKHRSTIGKSALKTILTAGHHHINDLYIPRTQHDQTAYRYYHIFGLQEIMRLHTMSGYVIQESGYSNKQGNLTQDRYHARNTWIVAKKSITKS